MTEEIELRAVALKQAVLRGGSLAEITEAAGIFLEFLLGSARTQAEPGREQPRHVWSSAGVTLLHKIYGTEPQIQRVYAAIREIERMPRLSRAAINAKARRYGLSRAGVISPELSAHMGDLAKVRAMQREISHRRFVEP